MATPKCLECLEKHLASALSYANEIVGGHGVGGNPDHRPDFSGEMINAEKHANVLNKTLALKIRAFRRKMQGQRWRPVECDFDTIRTFWCASLAIVGGPKLVDEIAKTDADFALMVALKLQEYNKLPTSPDASNITTDCGCLTGKKDNKPQYDVHPVKVLAFGISDKDKSELEENLKQFLEGFDSIEILPKSLEQKPIGLPGDDGFEYVFWPSNVRLLKKINVPSLPSVGQPNAFFSKDETAFLNTNDNAMRMEKTYKLPMHVFPAVAEHLYNQFLMTTGKKKFDDFYSIYKCFTLDPIVSISCGVFVNKGENPKPDTIYEII